MRQPGNRKFRECSNPIKLNAMLPSFGAATACIVINADDEANLMILKTAGKNISGAVGSGIDQQRYWPLVNLPRVIGLFRIGQPSVNVLPLATPRNTPVTHLSKPFLAAVMLPLSCFARLCRAASIVSRLVSFASTR